MTRIDEQLKLKMLSNVFDEIERLKGDDSDYIDAIVTYCENNNVDIETFGDFVKSVPSLKSKIECEAENLNYLPKRSRLPI